MKKEPKELFVEIKDTITGLIEEGAIYFLVAMLWIFAAIVVGMILYLLYLTRNIIIKFFLLLLLTIIGICILLILIALIKNFFSFILSKIKKILKNK